MLRCRLYVRLIVYGLIDYKEVEMYGWRSQIGFIVPTNNTVIEPEMYSIVPEGVSFHFTKVIFKDTTRDGRNKDAGGEAAEALHRGHVNVIAYACMATSLVDAPNWERETTEQFGVPAVAAATALKEALRAVGAHNIALVCHYPQERLPLVKESFKNDGFNVVSAETADISDQREVNRIPTEKVYELARKANTSEADAICLLATDLRTFPILQQLEDDLGKPVVSNNQSLLWKALRLADIKAEIPGHGSLLAGDYAKWTSGRNLQTASAD